MITSKVEALYGAVDWTAATGILHVAAIASPSGPIIALGPAAPRSSTDRFVLGLARTRADVIVTTGAILRAEPELVHTYSDDEAENRAMAQWRRRELNRPDPPAIVVLSASGDFRIDHPALRAARSGFVWSTAAGRARLRATELELPVEIDDGEANGAARKEARSGLDAALARMRERLGAQTILIEAGPTTADLLYPEYPEPSSRGMHDARVEELLLSLFEGALNPEAVGPPFVDAEKIRTLFGAPVSCTRVDEASGPWRFERMRAPDRG